jgi:hypothetical protein
MLVLVKMPLKAALDIVLKILQLFVMLASIYDRETKRLRSGLRPSDSRLDGTTTISRLCLVL